MLFETHITVDSTDVGGWLKCCKDASLKSLYIELSQGKHRHQLLSASTFRVNHLGEADICVSRLCRCITDNGFKILRIKLECPLDETPHDGLVPAYFECHIKFPLIKDGRGVKETARRTKTAASEDLLARDGNFQKWYLTARHYFEPELYNRKKMSDEDQARYKFLETRKLVEDSLSVRSMDMECVIYDTNPGLDEGWVQ